MARRSPSDPSDPEAVRQRLERHLSTVGFRHTLGTLDEHLEWASRDRPGATTLLEHVFAEEAAHKLEHRVQRRIDTCGIKEKKTLAAFDWAFQPKLDKSLVLELAELDFVRRKDDLIITGQSGTGKSHILQAITLGACQAQMRVRYARCVDLLDDLYAGLADDTYPQRLRRWASAELLVIDDVGLGQVRKRDDEPTAAHTLFNLVDRRHAVATTAVTSNIDLKAWGNYLGDVTIAAAILDRLTMRAIRIDIDGPSYRQHLAQQRAKERSRAGKTHKS
jgi:DNA replication protein DnaC